MVPCAPMPASAFDEVSPRYARVSTAQTSAGEILLALARVGPAEDVLDVGCGAGVLTARVRALTGGRVAAVDPSAGMIVAAQRALGDGVELRQCAAEDLPHRAEFDLVLSNSALHWFRDVPRALARMCAALRPGGRAAIQAPATAAYCPEFVDAMAEVARDPRTRDAFEGFSSPWFFLERADVYAEALRAAGFDVALARLDELATRETPRATMRIFGSGAEAGYLDAGRYEAPLPAGYAETVREIVRASLARRAGADGRVELRFRRVFLVGRAG